MRGKIMLAIAAAIVLTGCGASGTPSASPVTVEVTINSHHPTRTTGDGSRVTVNVPAPTQLASTSIPVTHKLNGIGVWVSWWTGARAVSTAIAHAGVISVAHPFWYEVKGDDTVIEQAGTAGQKEAVILHDHGLSVIPTVTETAGMDTFARMLADPAEHARLLATLEWIARLPGMSGIDLDFENLAAGSGSATAAAVVTSEYPQFVDQLCAYVHLHDEACEVTVMAQSATPTPHPGGLDPAVYNYPALAQVADRIQVMAYDDHVAAGAAGPVAPMPWVQSVLNYALTQIPAGKLVLGLAAYGYDWASNGDNATLTAAGAEQRALDTGAQVHWDPVQQESWFSYRQGKVRHFVWFEGARADYVRAALAADEHLAGVSLWAEGDETPGLWPRLAQLVR